MQQKRPNYIALANFAGFAIEANDFAGVDRILKTGSRILHPQDALHFFNMVNAMIDRYLAEARAYEAELLAKSNGVLAA